MGYNTKFFLDVQPPAARVAVRAAALDCQFELLDLAKHGECEGKWYEWEDELKAFSKSVPGATLVVTGWGEERGDIWRAFVKDGQLVKQKAEITFPEEPKL